MTTLANPPTNLSYKTSVKSRIIYFCGKKLRLDASKLPSFAYFKPQYFSLCKPHPIWKSAGSNPYEVEKASVQSNILSSRYRTRWLSRYWSGDSSGSCNLPNCHLDPTPGTLKHILTECETLAPARKRMFTMWSEFLNDNPILLPIIA